ncbi:MAG: 1-deoxy-D-xylulose-5-phosphate reductoisomerase [Erysipelotrichaceae bacterium]|nr:1-deoxy-D-xylulose-5-phosphate reductoisomerase [Erysipelotrichaceae bacterium]
MKRIVLLGASGSIGDQVLDIVEDHPDQYVIIGLSVGRRVEKLAAYLRSHDVPYACVQYEEDRKALEVEFPNTVFFSGDEGLKKMSELQCDLFINALVGFAGVVPTLTAIKTGNTIALANKETLVAAGELVNQALQENNVKILPIDSEHSAIFQCIQNAPSSDVKRLIITASGGSFRDRTREELANVTVKDALSHPNWSMGSKITIDSATMMNKGFEVIEAHYLFDLPYTSIDTIMHRESIIHSMVEFKDHSVLAQLGQADMRIPIQVALSHPERLEMQRDNRLDLLKVGTLHFEELSHERYPLLALAYRVGKAKGALPCVMNAANEVAVSRFLKGEISFLDIERIVIGMVDAYENHPITSVDQLIQIDQETREKALLF